MYKNDLSAAHARIRSLESALAAAAPRPAVARQQAPPARVAPPRVARPSGFPIYYHRPRTHWPLLRDFIRAARKRPSFAYPRPDSDSLILWLGYFMVWPIARLLVPFLALAFIGLIVIPSVLAVLIPTSFVLLPFAVLGGLKIRGRAQKPRNSFWSGDSSGHSLWFYWWCVGIYAAIPATGYAIYRIVSGLT